jgi:stress response protein YsnF
VLIIPVVEEILVVEKRLLLREEVRLSKRLTTTSVPQKVTLRREVVDIERVDSSGNPAEGTGETADGTTAAVEE